MKFKGKIVCKECRTVLNQSGEPVLEREKAWCARQAIYMCKPECEHVRENEGYKAHGIFTAVEVEWEEWAA